MATENNTFIDRLNTEKNELDEKISKLKKFLGSVKISVVEISEYQHNLLKDQLFHMENYSGVLSARIKDLTIST